MKLRRKDKIENIIKNLKVQHNELYISYCGNNPIGIEKYFSNEDNLRSFPPDGKLKVSELDYFYYILYKESIVGFYRITDLFFKGSIELHGSFNKQNTFLIKSYFELTKIFVSNIFIVFPNKRILTMVQLTNKGVIGFLSYLNFIRIGKDKQNKNFTVYEKLYNVKVKVIKSQPNYSTLDIDNYIYLEAGESNFDYDDKCFLETKSFNKKHRIVRITNYYEENEVKKSQTIYRKAICGNRNPNLGITKKNEIGLLYRDLIKLNIKHFDNASIKISTDIFCFISFYIFNPMCAINISIILLFLGMLSIVIAIFNFL
jgi:hypothetical protein